MLYTILIYGTDDEVAALSRKEDDALIARHLVVQEQLTAAGQLGPVVRLMPSTTATTYRRDGATLVTDGPFAETKEQLLGLYVVDATLEKAIEVARALPALPKTTFEIRPVSLFFPGCGVK